MSALRDINCPLATSCRVRRRSRQQGPVLQFHPHNETQTQQNFTNSASVAWFSETLHFVGAAY